MANRKSLVVYCWLVLIGLASACNMAPAPTSRPTFKIAESKSYEASLFRQHCAICHGAEANGKTMNNVEIPSLRYGDAAKKSDEEIYQQIKNGKMPMPPFREQLTEDEIRKMVLFVRRDLQGRQ